MKFELTKEEMEKVRKWMESMPEANEGAIGGRYIYQFIPTSIGLCYGVKDVVTGQTLDLTDYDNW